MRKDNTDQDKGLHRRTFTKLSGFGAFGLLSGVPKPGQESIGDDVSCNKASQEGQQDLNSQRIGTSLRVSPRDFHEENYEITHTYRRSEAIRTLLRDPQVNEIASTWIGSFEAYEPLTNTLGSISIQGCPDYSVSGSFEKGSWDITAQQRQAIYGLVDRRHNELVALQINDPIDVTWTEKYDKETLKRGQVLYNQPEVKEFLSGKDWWPSIKVGESITSGEGLPHGGVTIVTMPAVSDDSLSMVSGFLDVTGEQPEFVDAYFVDKFVRYPIQQWANEITPDDASVLGEVPKVPVEKRPFKTANNGYHRFATLPDNNFSDAGWEMHWEQPETMGVKMKAQFKGQPVFDAMNGITPTTFTAYDLPPRNGRNTLNWFFPDNEPLINGHHIFWDVHSVPFGGPGALAKVDYPERRGHPKGFQFRTHFHTGAEGKSSIDFHSGIRFGPYNYNISYEFFEDGRMVPIWRRMGPGYVTESLYGYGQPEDYEGEENVVQQYISAHAFEVTPGTNEGVEVHLFDGDDWCTPSTEFYHVGEPDTKLRFTNPNGSQTIDVPMNRDMEAVVLRPKSDEIGPVKTQAMRSIDLDPEVQYYHPAQYADGDPIQGERVVLWLLLEASTDEVPHPAGVTGYAALGELQLKGY